MMSTQPIEKIKIKIISKEKKGNRNYNKNKNKFINKKSAKKANYSLQIVVDFGAN